VPAIAANAEWIAECGLSTFVLMEREKERWRSFAATLSVGELDHRWAVEYGYVG
jgi:hypothetical protein